jgi:hypothetical protein
VTPSSTAWAFEATARAIAEAVSASKEISRSHGATISRSTRVDDRHARVIVNRLIRSASSGRDAFTRRATTTRRRVESAREHVARG